MEDRGGSQEDRPMQTVMTKHKTSPVQKDGTGHTTLLQPPSVGKWLKCSRINGSKHSTVELPCGWWGFCMRKSACEIKCASLSDYTAYMQG